MKRVKKIAGVKIHDIWFDIPAFVKDDSSIVMLHTNDVIDKNDYGFKISQKTIVIDISRDMDDVFKDFEKKSARYPIHKAEKDGVIVKKISTEMELSRYCSFEEDFCKNKGIPVPGRKEMDDLIIYYAVSDVDEYLGGCAFIVSDDGKTVRYKYGATLHKLNANELILWRAMNDFHEQGFIFFDMGGCVPTEDKDTYNYRHYQFKKKFGGNLTDSYTYFKARGLYKIILKILVFISDVVYKGDTNNMVNSINKIFKIS